MLSHAMAAALASPRRDPIWLAAIETATGMLRCTSALTPLDWDGETWLGVGHLYGLGTIDRGDALSWRQQQLVLNGLPEEAMAGLDEDVAGRSAKLWLGMLDGGGRVVRDPLLVADMLQDTLNREVDVAAGTVTLRLNCYEAMPRFDRASGLRWSHDSQQVRFATDEGFYYTQAIGRGAGQQIDWRPAT